MTCIFQLHFRINLIPSHVVTDKVSLTYFCMLFRFEDCQPATPLVLFQLHAYLGHFQSESATATSAT